MRSALPLAIALAAFTLPLPAQTSAGIPGVVAAGEKPELVKEGFVFTEGPVGTYDGGLIPSVGSGRAARESHGLCDPHDASLDGDCGAVPERTQSA